MITVGEKNGFKIVFDCDAQAYTVYKDGQFLIGNKYRFRDVKTYIA